MTLCRERERERDRKREREREREREGGRESCEMDIDISHLKMCKRDLRNMQKRPAKWT
jgi:hypothetical protein